MAHSQTELSGSFAVSPDRRDLSAVPLPRDSSSVPLPRDSCSADVVIVAYNSGDFLNRCVHSVLATSGVDRVLVIDNASTDQSVANLVADNRLIVLTQPKNLGFAAAANIGWQSSRQPWVLFLNPDCELKSNDLSELMQAAQQTAKPGIISCMLCNADGSDQRTSLRFDATPKRAIAQALGLSAWGINRKAPNPAALVTVEACSGALMLMPREVLRACGGLDEGYFLHCEDLDLCRRVRALGYAVLVDTRVRVRHDKGTSSAAVPRLVADAKYFGTLRYFDKFDASNTPTPIGWLLKLGAWLRWQLLR
jgi:N-acetylglucosaminyl-diphospho-decaprenol L-rhamnosyltransferase